MVGYDTGSATAAFMWDPVNGTQLLNNVVPNGWNITEAVTINDSGTILALGTKGVYNGYVLLEPAPEPSTLSLATA
jgi:hypothetical protein